MGKSFLLAAFFLLYFASDLSAYEKILQNDDQKETSEIKFTGIDIAVNEIYAARFNANQADYPYSIKSLQIFMTDNPNTIGVECGYFYIVIWNDNGGKDPVTPPIFDSEKLGTDGIWFEIAGNNSIIFEIDFASSSLFPPVVNSGSIRVGLKAADTQCILTTGTSGKFPILLSDSSGKAGTSFIYGSPGFGMPSQWFDIFSDLMVNGDFVMRLKIDASGIPQPDTTEKPVEAKEETADEIIGEVVQDTFAAEDISVNDKDEGIADGHDAALSDITSDKSETSSLKLIGISPSSGKEDTDVPVTIVGEGFKTGMTARLDNTALLNVAIVDSKMAAAVVPKGMETGKKSLFVQNTDGNAAYLLNAYEVLESDKTKSSGCSISHTSRPECFFIIILLSFFLIVRALRRSHNY
jgi:hypothetical protein